MNEGNRVRELRKTIGLTLEKFAEPLGVKKAAISNIENNTRGLTDQMILSICREYNVNEDWLRTGDGEMFVKIDRESELMRWAGSVLGSVDDSFKKRFVKMLSELDDRDWETLEKIALKLHNKED